MLPRQIIKRVKKGDRVVIPFVIACGSCSFCRAGNTALCETTNTGREMLTRDLTGAAGAYKTFVEKRDAATKFVMHPKGL